MPDLPPYALIAAYSVKDFDHWLATFDSNQGMRAEAGYLGHHVNRGEDDPNRVAVYLAVADLEKAKAMLTSPELMEVMQDAGIIPSPAFTWLVPKREAVVWDRQLPAMIIRHSVADFDAWLDAYDAAGDLQKSNGIVGHAANQMLDDPSSAVIYHQAESFDALRAFLANPELRSVMEAAGVTSEPDVAFGTGGWAKLY